MLTIKESTEILKRMKDYYNNEEHDKYYGFNSDDNEAIDKAIRLLEQEETGYTHQKVERNIFKEIMLNADKMCAFVQLQRGIHNFIEVMKDIDIQVDIQTKKGG